MPAVYAHNRFGEKVLDQMNDELKETVLSHPRAYRMGLQGPDIFFFYHPFYPNRVQKYGTTMHHSDAAPFFQHARSVVNQYGKTSSQYAYLLGFICHFALDSECHPYISKQIDKSGVAHMEIEAEFEKVLMRKDGLDPLTYPLNHLIFTDQDTADAVASFFPSISESAARASLRGMRFVKWFFDAPMPVRHGYAAIMKALGIYHTCNGLMIQDTDNPNCEESNRKLSDLFECAVPLAVSLQEQFDALLSTKEPLPDRFHRTFE